MADDDKSVSVGISHKGWLGAVGFSALIVLLVAVGVTDFFGLLTVIVEGARSAISFSDGLYFSLITMSAVGYGDMMSAGEAVRVVTAIEVMLGILLFLFGFAEIMRYVREADGKSGADE
ncbi:MAG: potassium channel family protein [Alphaproteobacteria bacterium]